MAGKMQENLDETASSDINNSEERPENNSDGTNNKGRMFSVGNQGRCAKQRSKSVYPKKKKVDDDNNSTTHKKVIDVNMVDDAAEKNKVEGYRLLGMGIFAELVKDLLCPVCSKLYVSTDHSKRKGLSFYIEIKCTCGYYRSEFSSPTIKMSGKGLKCLCKHQMCICNDKLWTRV